MKLSRFQPIYNGLNGVAKRVYEAVPISAPWSTHKIISELERKGSHMDFKAVQGCLGYMLSVGIIERNKDGDYIRTAIKIATTAPDTTTVTPPPTQEETLMATTPSTNTPVTQPTVFDMLAKLAQRAQEISDSADELKQDIEMAALHVQADMEKNTVELSKLRQLKALLGSLNE